MQGIAKIIMALALAAPLFGAAVPPAVAVNIGGVIHPVTAEIVGTAIARAASEHAPVVIVRLNTPGGLMDGMRETIEKIAASPVPVITYVAPAGGRAASAGFFLLEAGDVAAMAPGTNTGAAHPVAMTGQMDAVMQEKVVNDAAAYLRSLCTKRNRNAALAETAVRQSQSFTDQEALDDHLVDLIAGSDSGLLAAIDGRTVTRFDGRSVTLHTAGAAIENYRPSIRQQVLSGIADPNIAFILLVIGALLIYVEFSSPGIIAPGVFGSILLLLGLAGLSVLPINWLGATLLALGLVLFALEAKFAAHGILGVGGAAAMVLGAVLLVNSPIPEMRIHWLTAFAVVLPFSLITAMLVSLAVRARRAKVETGREGMIGEIGSALTDLAPAGKVFVHGEYWDAVSLRPVAAGAGVRVTAMEKLRLTVEPFDSAAGRPPAS